VRVSRSSAKAGEQPAVLLEVPVPEEQGRSASLRVPSQGLGELAVPEQ